MDGHPRDVTKYLARLYAPGRRQFACRARTTKGFMVWRTKARQAFRELLGLPRIAEDASGHTPEVSVVSDRDEQGGHFRQRASIETEPGVRIEFWLLTPKGRGPFPLAVTPHGHENGDTYAGLWHDRRSRMQVEKEDQDIAVQAAEKGFLTIAPATRGMGANPRSFGIGDVANRHDGRDCRCHNWQIVVAGRTMLGERVWDLMRILDWALALPEIDRNMVLLMGNSGGGMATLHTAAADERVSISVPCCSYSNYVSPHGILRHCPCNAIPGILTFGEYWDVAGLVAPRYLLTVNGAADPLHPVDEVDHAASRLRSIYRASGCPERYEHRYGDGGHRFFSALMWPWIDKAMQDLAAT